MQNFLIILVFLFFGMLVQRFGRLPASSPMVLNNLVINLVLPAVILLNVPNLNMDKSLLFPMFAGWVVVAISALLIIWIGKWQQWPRSEVGALLLVAVLGNTSYLGFPMVVSLFGQEGLAYAIIYDQLGNFVPLAIYGTLVIALYSQSEISPTPAGILMRIVTFPPFVALMFALIVPVSYPDWLIDTLGLIGLTLLPLTMFIVGLQFRLQVKPEHRGPLFTALGIKMVLAPALVLGMGMLLGYQGLLLAVTVFEAAMPAMVTAGAMGMAANLAPRLCVAIVGIGLLCAFVLLPLYAQGLKWLLL